MQLCTNWLFQHLVFHVRKQRLHNITDSAESIEDNNIEITSMNDEVQFKQFFKTIPIKQ